jgi:hypothetical protein
MEQSNSITSLGQRMVDLARIAVAMHLEMAGATNSAAERMLRQQVAIGGADFRGTDSVIADSIHHADQVTDDGLPPAAGRPE